MLTAHYGKTTTAAILAAVVMAGTPAAAVAGGTSGPVAHSAKVTKKKTKKHCVKFKTVKGKKGSVKRCAKYSS